ncbi:MAG: two-component regulator propeller domain-containing protein [Bacteroidota bacterium]|nr:two-component regulator propeller domain-containing protein [Bacteroidota bacterium]
MYAQNSPLQFEHISIESGLSQSSARCLLQDRYGFLWIGSQDGLNRYDGYEFKVYKYDALDSNSLTGNFISCLLEDREGLLWIGTIGGLTRFDPVNNTFTRYFPDKKNNSALQGESVLALCEDNDGNIWAATYLGGISKFDKKSNSFKTFVNDPNDPKSISNNFVTDISKDNKGNLWIGTFGGGLNKLFPRTGTFDHYYSDPQRKNSLSSNIITSLVWYSDDTLLIGTHNGFNVFNPKTNVSALYTNDPNNDRSISSNPIQKIYLDTTGRIWIGTYDAGLNRFDKVTGTFIHYQKNENDLRSLNSNSIPAILVDRNNVLWVGSGTNGLNKCNLNPRMFSIIKNNRENKNSLSSNMIRSIFEGSRGNIWVGTDVGLNKIEKQTKNITRYISEPANKSTLSDNRIWTINEDKNGILWIGTQSGLNKYDPVKNVFIRYVYDPKDPKSIPYNLIVSIYIDSANILWLGSSGGGLILYNSRKNEFKQYFHRDEDPNSISDNIVFEVYQGRSKLIWICTPTGLNSFDPTAKKFVRYTQLKFSNRSQESKTIFSIYEDEQGILWLGSLGDGLIRFDVEQQQVKNYTEKDGLPNNVVYAIVPDSKSNLWLSTNKGLSRFDKTTEKFKNYDMTDGLPSNEFNSGAKLRTHENKLYFGGIEGIVHFDPLNVQENKYIPSVIVSRFKVLEKEYRKDKTYYGGEEIHLTYADNYFSFEFAGLEFTEPTKNQYAYKLEGLDNDWIYSGNRRYVGYTHLEPGEFTFRVKASNNDGLWNDKGIAIKIIISPPFWKTWWFIASMIILISGIIYSWIRQRINRLKKEAKSQELFSKQLMEVYEIERKRIASELHDGLGQNLLIIANRAKMGLKKEEMPSMQKEFEIISSSALESINDVRKISYNLHPLQIDEVGITTAIESMLKRIATLIDNKLSFTIENIDGILSEEKRIHFYRIIQETLNNAIKHSSAETIEVIVVKEEGSIRAVIKDDGKGFDSKIKGEGYGMRSLNERIKILGGKFTIESSPGGGTVIKIIIPINTKE